MKQSIPVIAKKESEFSAEEVEPPSPTAQVEPNPPESHPLFPEYIPFPISRNERGSLRISSRSIQFLTTYFPGATKQDWSSWEWQIRNSFTTLDQLRRVFRLSDEELLAYADIEGNLPLRITPYYASLIDPYDPVGPLRKSMIPQQAEKIISVEEAADPLSEDHDTKVPGLVHRYPDRVLFLVTGFCSAYCRYCTRSRLVGDQNKRHLNLEQWERALAYIEANPQVRDVLLSGGDPLTLSDSCLNYLLKRLSRIPHVEFVRIGTKVPVVLPQRVTTGLVQMLKRFRPLWMSIHFTHPDEITPETAQAVERLADAGIPLGSQTVLLKGINDDVAVLKKLYHELLKIRVRPYYLYQCDPIVGSSHFRTPVSKGIEIIEGLRGHTSGYAVPQYVIDAPGGGGKIPLLPDYCQGKEGDKIVLRNFEGKTFYYPDR